MAPRLALFAFRYRDPRTGKWVRARYRADRDEIAARYAEWEIIGPTEIRDVDPGPRYFTPHQSPLDAELRRYSERPLELQRRSCSRCSSAATSPIAPGAAGSPQ